MTEPPPRPKIYHITHVHNLASIIEDGELVSDRAMIERGGPKRRIGMSEIKRRRLELPTRCHLGDTVGDYVPFYFCPRSVMLYVIYCRNHPDLEYKAGQEAVIHMESDLHEVVSWADREHRRWAFSLSNAGAYYAQFRKNVSELCDVDWVAVEATDFRSVSIKEGKQAEFLVHGSFPWKLVTHIGVCSTRIKVEVEEILQSAESRPSVDVVAEWYF